MASFNSLALKHGAALSLLVTLLTGTATGVSDSDMCFVSPVDQCQDNQFAELGSTDADTDGRPFWFDSQISNGESGTIYLEYKDSDSNTFSQVNSRTYRSEWGTSNNIVFNEDQSTTIAEGGSDTLIINGNEHTIDVRSDGLFVDSSATFELDGSLMSRDVGEYFTVENSYIQVYRVYDDGGTEYAEFKVFSEITAPEDYNEYRTRFVPDSGSTSYSDSVFFSVDLGQNIPADQGVRVNDEAIDQPRTLTEVTPNSNINLTIFQDDERDPVNVTLVTETGTEVATISTGDEYGAFRSIYDDFSDSLLSSFRGGSNNTFIFPTLDSDLLSEQGQEYSFYFEIMDKGEASNPVRTTKMYTVETSGTATNQAPTVSNLEASTYDAPNTYEPVENLSFGDSIYEVRAQITDPDNEFLDAQLYLEEEYDGEVHFNNVSYDGQVGDTYSWSCITNCTIDVDDSGGWTAQVYASDGADNNASDSASWSYPHSEPEISQNFSTTSVERYETFQVSDVISCPEYECINENESINDYLDPVQKSSEKPVWAGLAMLILQVFQ